MLSVELPGKVGLMREERGYFIFKTTKLLLSSGLDPCSSPYF
jgi:hypothetical protein